MTAGSQDSHEKLFAFESPLPSPMNSDIEKSIDNAHLANATLKSFAWTNVSVTVQDRSSSVPRQILDRVSGIVKAGQMMAIMGPSGSGKTTLLNVLAKRNVGQASVIEARLVNGRHIAGPEFRRLSCYIEQEEALLGALTVKETLHFAAKLSLPSTISEAERKERIETLLAAVGLTKRANTLIGTPIRKGVSSGEKRRASIASQLITGPKIVFLDEPTGSLDSASAYEVMSFVRTIAQKYRLVVIASIHQPSTMTFNLFDQLLLLSHGHTVFNGPVAEVAQYFAAHGHEIPRYMNPAEFILEIANNDFADNRQSAEARLLDLTLNWQASLQSFIVQQDITACRNAGYPAIANGEDRTICQKILVPFTLVHRNLIKSYRDITAYGIRIVMYVGLAILMGTVWLRLSTVQDNIGAFINAIFYGGAFMSFMAVAYIPSYLEDRTLFMKEWANGLYGPTSFMIANFIIGIPFLFLICVIFSTIVYWLGNFRPTAEGFWMWVFWLFLDLVAAESLVILITNILPIFVVSLAAVAFANGLWMSVNGFMVTPHTLNAFWKYVFHYIDYQAYVFQGMMVNEFSKRIYDCERLAENECHCIFVTGLQDICKIDGKGVLEAYGYNQHKTGLWIGILVCIIAVYRLLAWLSLFLKRM